MPLECRRRLRHLSDAIGAQPNQRVKLAAPSPESVDAACRGGVIQLLV